MPKYKVFVELEPFEAADAKQAQNIVSDMLRWGYSPILDGETDLDKDPVAQATGSISYDVKLCSCGCNAAQMMRGKGKKK